MGDEKKDEDKPLGVWKFLNSSFALWLLSAVFITGVGSAFAQWQAQVAEDRKNKEQIERIDLEISYRFAQLLVQLDDLRASKLGDGERAKEVARLYDGFREQSSSTIGFLYQDYKGWGVLALQAEERRLLSGAERDQVDNTIAALAMKKSLAEESRSSNLEEAGASLLGLMAPRWKTTRFAFVDCPVQKPFC